MSIFRHPGGVYKRYPPPANPPPPAQQAEDEYTNPKNWKQIPGAKPGIEIHRDGKTMRNTAPGKQTHLRRNEEDRPARGQ